jgi:hypothetical protein
VRRADFLVIRTIRMPTPVPGSLVKGEPYYNRLAAFGSTGLDAPSLESVLISDYARYYGPYFAPFAIPSRTLRLEAKRSSG